MSKPGYVIFTHVKDYAISFAGVMLLTALYFTVHNQYHIWKELEKEQALEKEIEALNNLHFEDFIDYHSIHPRTPTARLGGEVWHWSDVTIHKGGYRLEWREHIQCDFNPFDGTEHWSYFRKLTTTDMLVKGAKPRRTTNEDGQNPSSFPSYAVGTDKIATYPLEPADCRIVSDMYQYHSYGLIKQNTTIGNVVQVR